MEAIIESQAKLQQLFLQRMDDFQEQLQKTPNTASGESSVTAEFASFKTFILTALKGLQQQISVLAREVDNIEMRSRRKILLLHGIPEPDKEDTADTVVKVVVDKLKLSQFTATDISRCHRMGRSSTPNKPRPILVKVRDLSMRNSIWRVKTLLKSTGITISEFLTKPRHDTFMAARQRFGINKCWTRDGYVHVLGNDGKRYRLSNILELDQIAMSVPSKPAEPAARAAAQAAPAPKMRRAAASKK